MKQEKNLKQTYVQQIVLEFECHLDIQADSSNNVYSKRMENEDTN